MVALSVDRAHVADAGASVLNGVDGARAFDGVDGPNGCLWSQQESDNNRDNYSKSRASLTCYTSTDTVALGVDRAHDVDARVSVTDGTDRDYVSSSVDTDRAAASDATGF